MLTLRKIDERLKKNKLIRDGLYNRIYDTSKGLFIFRMSYKNIIELRQVVILLKNK